MCQNGINRRSEVPWNPVRPCLPSFAPSSAERVSRRARELGVTPSACRSSRALTRLERRLGGGCSGVRRRRARSISNGRSGSSGKSQTRSRTSCASASGRAAAFEMSLGTAFATYALLPALPEFMTRYPEITLDLVVTEYPIDSRRSRDRSRDPHRPSGGRQPRRPPYRRSRTRDIRRAGVSRQAWRAAEAGGPGAPQLPHADRASPVRRSGRFAGRTACGRWR